jgi:peptidyl-prolyl cis-trans isomerase B (cyclophilin B)
MNLKRSSFVFTVIAMLSVSIFSQTTPDAKKTNIRPDPPAAKEPFDNAAVAEMAKQCVSLNTEQGLIVIEMYPESAPESVRNFLNLTATGLLDTTTFSRVVPNFVIQGGDLYTREGEMTRTIGLRARKIVPDEPSSIRHERGIISMARGDEPNTATTNFFILVDSASYLDGKFAAFGRVTKGRDVVDAINKADVTDEKPAKPVRIRKASVATCD